MWPSHLAVCTQQYSVFYKWKCSQSSIKWPPSIKPPVIKVPKLLLVKYFIQNLFKVATSLKWLLPPFWTSLWGFCIFFTLLSNHPKSNKWTWGVWKRWWPIKSPKWDATTFRNFQTVILCQIKWSIVYALKLPSRKRQTHVQDSFK